MTATAQPSGRRHLSAADTLETLRNPTIARLVSATLLNSAGNIVYNVGVAWLAYQLTSSSLVVGSLNGVRTLPVLLLGPFVGLLLDRFHRPTVVKVNAAYTALLAVAFLALVTAGEVQVWHLYAYMLLVGVGFAVGVPARRSVYADTVDRSLLLNALSLDLLAFEVVRIGAPALAGLTIATLGWLLNAAMLQLQARVLLPQRVREK